MITTNDIIKNFLDQIQKDLVINYDRLGLRASGNWEKSLEQFQESTKQGFRIGILGAGYTTFMENGRGVTRTTIAGNPTLREKIRQWLDIKGIVPKGKISKDSLAFLIARKIHREGIKVPNRYNKGGLVSNVVNKKAIEDLNRHLALFYVSGFKSDVIKNLK